MNKIGKPPARTEYRTKENLFALKSRNVKWISGGQVIAVVYGRLLCAVCRTISETGLVDIGRKHIKRFGNGIVAIVSRTNSDVRLSGRYDISKPPTGWTAPTGGPREEIPVSKRTVAHRRISDVVGRQTEQFELQTNSAGGN